MQIVPKPNKARTREELKCYLLAHCDADIALTFAPHGFLLEPLLLQVIRDLHRLRKGEAEYVDADYFREIELRFRHLTGSDDGPADPGGAARAEGPGDRGAESEPEAAAGDADAGGEPERERP